MASLISTFKKDDELPQPSMEQIATFQARRRWAKVAWVYSALLLVATVMLGTFRCRFSSKFER
ncbi:maltose/maltodextrin ABC transporter permease protein MalG [Vibrio astriarenae]|nr:maltose/maltodextrin ABC transporter permease protein MalG [Vibrio sp. C7]